jgi:hypothetical protein
MWEAFGFGMEKEASDAEKAKARSVQRLLYWIMAVFILAPLVAAYLLG